jgi:hypothetical protein
MFQFNMHCTGREKISIKKIKALHNDDSYIFYNSNDATFITQMMMPVIMDLGPSRDMRIIEIFNYHNTYICTKIFRFCKF